MVATGWQPVDQAVRERVISTFDRSLCVEAGAGAGKTTLMVERVLALLRSGRATIDQIVLISFTERAASELRARLRERLEEALAADPDAGWCDQALSGLDAAPIGTIHGFAGSILRLRPLEAGLAPGFTPLDEVTGTLDFETAWESWLLDELDREPPALRNALSLGLTLTHVRTLAERLHEHRALLPLTLDVPPAPDLAQVRAAILNEVEQLQALAASCRKEEDAAYLQIAEIARWAERLPPAERLARALLFPPTIKAGGGSQTNWRPKEDLLQARELFGSLSARLADTVRALKQRALAEVVTWLERFVRESEERRRQEGTPSFDDLLLWTRDLLRDHLGVRAELQQRYRYLIVDEFQDTDPLQVEIMAFLAEDGARAHSWREVKLKPGKLCVVGDPKQAIYRFRRADLAVYASAKRLITGDGGPEDGEAVAIVQNFRSVAPLLDWVNRVFTSVIQEDAEGLSQPPYQAVAPAHPAHPGATRPPVVLATVAVSEEKPSAAALRRVEAAALAHAIRRAVAEGWPVRDRGGVRPAQLGDCALLFPTQTGIEVYEEALTNAGIAYRFEGGRLFWARQEVRDLTALVRVVDDPTDEVGVLAALGSSAFAIPAERLFLFREAGGRFNLLHPAPDGFPEFVAAWELLRDLHARRNLRPPGATLEELLARTHLPELWLLLPEGRQAAANLLKVVEQAHGFAARDGLSFRAFTRWLLRNGERTPREMESPVAEAGEPVLRLFTVHAAKGLEFPIVLLANLSGDRLIPADWVADRITGAAEFRLGGRDSGWQTPGYDAAREREQAHEDAERRRLLYVACTRARDHLVLPWYPTGGSGYAAFLTGLLPPPDAVPAEDCGWQDQFILAPPS